MFKGGVPGESAEAELSGECAKDPHEEEEEEASMFHAAHQIEPYCCCRQQIDFQSSNRLCSRVIEASRRPFSVRIPMAADLWGAKDKLPPV